MGAVLCRAYQEPLVPPPGTGEHPHPPTRLPTWFLSSELARRPCWCGVVDEIPHPQLGPYENHAPVYGSLKSFLSQQSKMRVQSQYYSRPGYLVPYFKINRFLITWMKCMLASYIPRLWGACLHS